MIAAYNSGSTMARTLESLEPGTPVYAGATRVGEVRGVYAEGDARMAELLRCGDSTKIESASF